MSTKLPFEVIVEKHGPTVLRVCLGVIGAAEADDAWSETFLSAMKAYPSLPADPNVEAWLVTIAHPPANQFGRAPSRRALPTDSILYPAAPSHRFKAYAELMAFLKAFTEKQTPSVAYP